MSSGKKKRERKGRPPHKSRYEDEGKRTGAREKARRTRQGRVGVSGTWDVNHDGGGYTATGNGTRRVLSVSEQSRSYEVTLRNGATYKFGTWAQPENTAIPHNALDDFNSAKGAIEGCKDEEKRGRGEETGGGGVTNIHYW